MARPVVGIYATAAPVSWGPWRDRPSAVVPAALAAAVQQAGNLVVLLAHDPPLENAELLRTLDALIVFDASVGEEHLAALRGAARAADLRLLVLDDPRVTPASSTKDFARAIGGLLAES